MRAVDLRGWRSEHWATPAWAAHRDVRAALEKAREAAGCEHDALVAALGLDALGLDDALHEASRHRADADAHHATLALDAMGEATGGAPSEAARVASTLATMYEARAAAARAAVERYEALAGHFHKEAEMHKGASR